jgi:hypothetical protein
MQLPRTDVLVSPGDTTAFRSQASGNGCEIELPVTLQDNAVGRRIANVRHAVWVFRDDCKYLTWSGRPLRSGRSARPLRERIKAREGKEALANLVPNRFMPPTAIADAHWQIYHQPRSAWVFEREIRPFGESGEGARGPFKVGEAQEERLWLVP